MKKKILIIISLFILLAAPYAIRAADTEIDLDSQGYQDQESQPEILYAGPRKDIIFEARVLEEMARDKTLDIMGREQILQKLKLIGLTEDFKGKEIIFDGITKQQATKDVYGPGDRVFVSVLTDHYGEESFYINDTVRYPKIYYLAAIFIAVVLIAGRKKGFTSLLGLAFTFLVIIKFVIPQIVGGADALVVTLISALIILVFSIYITHGFTKKATLSILGTFAGVSLVSIMSILSVKVLGLTGFYGEETMYLSAFMQNGFNPKNLMLAGFIFGALGVLDDIAMTQVSTVQELKTANPSLCKLELYKRAMKVGADHNASMINTLFLAYTGASITLLLLLSFKQPPFETLTQVINNEIVATEIVRTLVGSIGIVLTIPLTTLLAAYVFSTTKNNRNQKSNKKAILN
jgi:uncharacterized membrane protein